MNATVYGISVYDENLIVGGLFTTAGDKVSAYIAQWTKHYAGVGDVNGDGIIDIEDLIYLISYLYKNGSAPVPLENGDANCDQTIDVGDVVYLINYLFKDGLEPSC